VLGGAHKQEQTSLGDLVVLQPSGHLGVVEQRVIAADVKAQLL
jgi:hypothetical protein